MEVTVRRMKGARFEARARGLAVVVDRLPDAGGPGDGFRPTELVLAGLGACMAGTMITFAENQGIEVDDVTVELRSEDAKVPRRIGAVTVRLVVGGDLTERELQSLERVAAACKIGTTLQTPTDVELVFEHRPAQAANVD